VKARFEFERQRCGGPVSSARNVRKCGKGGEGHHLRGASQVIPRHYGTGPPERIFLRWRGQKCPSAIQSRRSARSSADRARWQVVAASKVKRFLVALLLPRLPSIRGAATIIPSLSLSAKFLEFQDQKALALAIAWLVLEEEGTWFWAGATPYHCSPEIFSCYEMETPARRRSSRTGGRKARSASTVAEGRESREEPARCRP